MNQSDRLPDIGIDPAYPSLDQGEKPVSPTLVFSIAWRRRYGILFMALLLSGAALAGLTLLKPSFVATASVLMQERRPIVVDFPTASGTIATDSVAVRTQADILRSADLARGVVRQLHLVDRPEFMAAAGPGMIGRLGEALRQTRLAGLLDWLGLFLPAFPPQADEQEEFATQTLLGMTSVVNDGRSYVIDIKVKVTAASEQQAPEAAALSARLANAYVDAYTQFTGTVKSDSIRQATGLFDQRIAVLQQKVRVAEDAVQAYRAQTGLLEVRALGGDGRPVTIASQQMAQLNTDLITAVSDRATKEAGLQQIAAARAGQGDLQSVSEVVASPLIQRLRGQQAELGAREASLAADRGSGSPELLAVRAAQKDATRQVAAETTKIAASLRTGVEAARGREAALRGRLAQVQAEVGSQGATEIRLRELQTETDIARQVYSTYLKRAQETANQVDMQEPDALVVSRSGVPLSPAPPSRKQLGAAAVAVSLFLAVLTALVRERMQSGFRTSKQFEASTGIATLGLVPKVKRLHAALAFEDRHSPFSEAIFSIRALLKLNMRQGSQVVMVTSALPQEGKTVLSSSLARNAAIAGERVLLIDCDLRRHAVARNITTASTVLLEDVTIQRDSFSPLDIITLTCGQRSPQDLFASDQMRAMLDALRKRYDLILLDTPPVLAASDARVLSALSDLTLFVVCWQKTPQHLVDTAVTALRSSGANVAGAVITQVRFNDLSLADRGHGFVYRPYPKYVTN